jgi:hypothetical protein
MATRIILNNVVLAFPALAEPQAFGDGDPAYGAKFPIAPNSEQQKAIEAAIFAEAKEAWKDKADSNLLRLIEDGGVCYVKKVYRSKKTGDPYQGFDGMHYLSTRSAKTQPSVYDQFNKEITSKGEIERKAFSGAIVRASLEFWAQDNKWGRRMNCSLRGVMLTGKGENFSGGSGAAGSDEFTSFAEAPVDASDFM